MFYRIQFPFSKASDLQKLQWWKGIFKKALISGVFRFICLFQILHRELRIVPASWITWLLPSTSPKLLLWFNLSQQISTTQPLTHSPSAYLGENWKVKGQLQHLQSVKRVTTHWYLSRKDWCLELETAKSINSLIQKQFANYLYKANQVSLHKSAATGALQGLKFGRR